MLSLFQRKRVPPTSGTPPTSAIETPKGSMRPESAASLLATPRRQFAALYLAPLERYAELVQQFPASENHHHAYPGGMLDHGLEIVAYALKLRQSYLLPAGVTPEAQAAQAEAWTAGTAYAALLHDIGKIAVDLHVEHADGSVWHPWHGPLRKPYRFRYRKEREYRLHSAATGLLYARLLDRDIFDWLSGYPDLWAALLYVLAGQYEHAGTLGELVVQADQASVAQELGGDPSKALAAPKHALQRKLLDGLRYLLKEAFKLNQAGPADGWLTQDALWLVSKTVSDKLRAHLLSQGIDGIPASNTAVFNMLQDHGIVQPTPFTGTVTVETVPATDDADTTGAPSESFSIADAPSKIAGTADQSDMTEALLSMIGMPDPAAPATVSDAVPLLESDESPYDGATASPPPVVPPPTAEMPSGEHFIARLQRGIATRRLIINDAKALVHTVADTAYLVSPGVFQRYAQEHPITASLARKDQMADWQWVQKRFEKLQLHRKQASGLNIWTCEVRGPRKTRRLHGYLLMEPSLVLTQSAADNPYLKLVVEPADKTL